MSASDDLMKDQQACERVAACASAFKDKRGQGAAFHGPTYVVGERALLPQLLGRAEDLPGLLLALGAADVGLVEDVACRRQAHKSGVL